MIVPLWATNHAAPPCIIVDGQSQSQTRLTRAASSSEHQLDSSEPLSVLKNPCGRSCMSDSNNCTWNHRSIPTICNLTERGIYTINHQPSSIKQCSRFTTHASHDTVHYGSPHSHLGISETPSLPHHRHTRTTESATLVCSTLDVALRTEPLAHSRLS